MYVQNGNHMRQTISESPLASFYKQILLPILSSKNKRLSLTNILNSFSQEWSCIRSGFDKKAQSNSKMGLFSQFNSDRFLLEQSGKSLNLQLCFWFTVRPTGLRGYFLKRRWCFVQGGETPNFSCQQRESSQSFHGVKIGKSGEQNMLFSQLSQNLQP